MVHVRSVQIITPDWAWLCNLQYWEEMTGFVTSFVTSKMDLTGLKIIEIRRKRQTNTKLLPSLRETKRRLLVCVTTSVHTEKQENGSLSALLLFKSLVQSPVAMPRRLRACSIRCIWFNDVSARTSSQFSLDQLSISLIACLGLSNRGFHTERNRTNFSSNSIERNRNLIERWNSILNEIGQHIFFFPNQIERNRN